MAGRPGRSRSGTCAGAFGRAARLPRTPLWVAPSGTGLLRSYDVSGTADFDRAHGNCAYVYDNAVAGLALLASGETQSAIRIGQALLAQHRVSGRVAVEEKPDVLWDRPDLERLYARLGFVLVGTVPGAFESPTRGRVGLHVMYRPLP